MFRLTKCSPNFNPSFLLSTSHPAFTSWRYSIKHNSSATLQLDTNLLKEHYIEQSPSPFPSNPDFLPSFNSSPFAFPIDHNKSTENASTSFSNSSSTSTPSSKVIFSFPPFHLTPIILPSPFVPINIKLKTQIENKTILSSTYRSSFIINESLALIHLMLQSGNMLRAEEIYKNLSQISPDTIRSVETTHLSNLFIQGYIRLMKLETEDPTSSLEHTLFWYTNMRKKKLKPDATTYALIFHGLILAKKENELHGFIKELKNSDSSVLLDSVVQHPFLISDLSSSSLDFLSTALKKHGLTFSHSGSCNTTAEANDLGSSLSLSSDSNFLLESETLKRQEFDEMSEWHASKLNIDTIKSVDSKGLLFLQEVLKHLKDLDPHQESFHLNTLQLKLEAYSYVCAFEKCEEATKNAPAASLQAENVKSLIWRWHVALKALFEKEIKAHTSFVSKKKGEKRLSKALNINFDESPWAYLGLLGPEKLSKITIVEMISLLANRDEKNCDDSPSEFAHMSGIRVNKCLPMLGAAFEAEFHADTLKSQAVKNSFDPVSMFYQSYLSHRKVTSQRTFRIGLSRLKKTLEAPIENADSLSRTPILVSESPTPLEEPDTSDFKNELLQSFPASLRAKLGGIALKLFCEIATFEHRFTCTETGADKTETLPVCFHTYEYVKGRKLGVLKPTPAFIEFLSKETGFSGFLRMLPMVVKPKPWTSVKSGGYLTHQFLCMRLKTESPEQGAYLFAADRQKRLDWVLASLDVLGETSWQIHPDVLRVAIEAWNSGEAIADFPLEYTPERIKDLKPKKPDDFETNPSAKAQYYRESNAFRTDVKNSYSLRCDNNYKIEIARSFLGYKLYFPHCIDFRGRAYPMPPLFNHMMSDLCRGLLTFGESKQLGERGWFWLKVHLASLYGVDKESFSNREKWVMNHLDDIFDSVDRPLTGKRWWLECDDPWQFLAACFEVAKAIRSGDPTTYSCSLPVHQDGTCNGLQHYAALGGDVAGARQVNLVKGDRPADVYLAVAGLVQKEIHDEALKGDERAKLLDGKVNRKVVKQTVMTFVYGVTYVGARTQIEARLKEIMDLDYATMYKVSSYLSLKVFKSIKHLFNRAQELQHWLNTAAKRISQSLPPNEQDFQNSVVWTTPLGLTCAQPYRRTKSTQVDTAFQSISLNDPNVITPVDSGKQKSAFPPNFIHSLDSSHMMMTAIECYNLGLTFAAVHDSYWTHPSDVDQMNLVIRRMFVELHSQPILENLLQEFRLRYKGYLMPSSFKDVSDPSSSPVKSKKRSSATSKSNADIQSITDILKNPEALSVDDLTEENNLLKTDEECFKDNGMEVFDEEKSDKSSKPKVRTKSKKPRGQYVPLEFPPLPRKGHFDIRNVLHSDYFFH